MFAFLILSLQFGQSNKSFKTIVTLPFSSLLTFKHEFLVLPDVMVHTALMTKHYSFSPHPSFFNDDPTRHRCYDSRDLIQDFIDQAYVSFTYDVQPLKTPSFARSKYLDVSIFDVFLQTVCCLCSLCCAVFVGRQQIKVRKQSK